MAINGSGFVMAVRAKGNSQNYPKLVKDCTETASSLSSTQTSRFLLVLFSVFYFSRIYLFVVFGPNQGRSCFGKRRAWVGMNETGWKTSGCPKNGRPNSAKFKKQNWLHVQQICYQGQERFQSKSLSTDFLWRSTCQQNNVITFENFPFNGKRYLGQAREITEAYIQRKKFSQFQASFHIFSLCWLWQMGQLLTTFVFSCQLCILSILASDLPKLFPKRNPKYRDPSRK